MNEEPRPSLEDRYNSLYVICGLLMTQLCLLHPRGPEHVFDMCEEALEGALSKRIRDGVGFAQHMGNDDARLLVSIFLNRVRGNLP